MSLIRSQSESTIARLSQGAGMMRSGSRNLLNTMHDKDTWEEQGGWKTSDSSMQKRAGMERDASMVDILNFVDPRSLQDRRPKPGEIITTDQHSALSKRGVALVAGASTGAWYMLRLLLRDVLQRGELMELHALSSIHSLGWVIFLFGKIGVSADELPKYCSRALVASLGFYCHECWSLRSTVLSNPSMLIHQASLAVTISSILHSKGVAWLAAPIMSAAVPSLIQELLRVCGTMGLQSARPEVRGLRLVWVLTFIASKLALLPAFFRNRTLPELHQPNLSSGKMSYLITFFLDLLSLRSALTDLPRFLSPKGKVVSASHAYRVPLTGVQNAANALVAATVLNTVFGSYLTGPTALVSLLLSLRAGAGGRVKALRNLLCSAIALDTALPQPKEMPEWLRKFIPIMRRTMWVFNFRTYPGDYFQKLPRDRHYLLGITPHGLFPWGVGALVVHCIEHGYLPNFIGASILGTLPVAGRLLRCFGFRPATPECIRECLAKPYPRNVTIILPGGIREMFHAREDIEISASNLHGGFAKLAVEGGAVLVPGYTYGVSQLYSVSKGALADFFQELSRKLKVSVVLFTGRWGTLLPHSGEMACALGEPIDCRVVTDAKEVHRLYVERLRDAYNKYKANFGWADRELYFEGEDIPPEPVGDLDEYTALPTSKL